MIQLIEQREGERALTVVSEREHHAYAFARARHAFDMRRIHHVIGHRLALRVVTRRIPLDQIRACQRDRQILVRARIHQARQGRGTEGRHRGLPRLLIALGLTIRVRHRQRILMHRHRVKRALVVLRHVVLDRHRRAIVKPHPVPISVRRHKR